MLQPIEEFYTSQEDGIVPGIPRATKEYLQVRFNAEVLFNGMTDKLKAQGYSEAYILGALRGLHEASRILDEIDQRSREES